MEIEKIIRIDEKKVLAIIPGSPPVLAADGDSPTQELYDYILANPEIPTQSYASYREEQEEQE